MNALRKFFKQHDVMSVNWNYALYMAENAEAWMQMQHLDEIFQTVLAGERLTDMDTKHFRATGQFRTDVPLERHISIAQQKLASIDRNLKAGGVRLHKTYRDAFYVAGLAMAEIQLEHPPPRKSRQKMKRFLEFLDQELNAFTPLLMHAAWLLFSNPPGKIRFFGGLQGTKNPLALVRNFSWDLQHWFWVQTAVSVPIRDGVFEIPLLMTFDKRFAEIVPALQARSFAICGRGNPQPIYPLDARDLVSLFTKDPNVQEVLFDPARVLARAERRTAANAELDGLIAAYETRLLERLRTAAASNHV
ncbi:MAG: hypothetical protein JOY92_10280 [Verrucomicrobia bacterium]|nr:hypothetical protein [Verrucomicrobiota bacterium]